MKVRSWSAQGTYEEGEQNFRGGGRDGGTGKTVLPNGASGTRIRAQGRNGVVEAVEQGI